MNKEKNISYDGNKNSPLGVGGILLFFALFITVSISAQKMKHPSLVFTSERIQQAKKQVKTDAKMEAAWNDIIKVADENLKKNDLLKTDYLALAYLMTDDKKYADKAKSILFSFSYNLASNNASRAKLIAAPRWGTEAFTVFSTFFPLLNQDQKSD